MFDAKRVHAADESYHTPPQPSEGLPVFATVSIADDWETTIPELVEDPPAIETVRKRLDTYLVETLAPALDE
jgi:hypothetical protein